MLLLLLSATNLHAVESAELENSMKAHCELARVLGVANYTNWPGLLEFKEDFNGVYPEGTTKKEFIALLEHHKKESNYPVYFHTVR